MLYGNIIFIKKTGGDGSKFPVTEKDVKIGRSDECLIRIYNSQVAPEHCQLIVEDNGQAILRNFSSRTMLNGKPLHEKEVTLCHGDVVKLGERLARWEYLPTSRFYKQLLSPTGRLVAVVIPQQRSWGDHGTPGTSGSHVSVLKNTPLENGSERYSERIISENSSAGKIRKSMGSYLHRKGKGDLPKFLTGRHSLRTRKSLLQETKMKDRKSLFNMSGSKTPKGKVIGKSRKSTLPSWKVNSVSPKTNHSESRSSITESNKKSANSPKNEVKTPLEKNRETKSQRLSLSVSKSGFKTPKKLKEDEEKSGTSKIAKTPLRPVVESPSKGNEGFVRSTRSFSKSPSPNKSSPKSPSKGVLSTPKQKSPKIKKIVHSESKINFHPVNQPTLPKGTKRMSLVLEKIDSDLMKNLDKEWSEIINMKETKVTKGTVSDSLSKTSVTEQQTRKFIKMTPGKLKKSPRKSLLNSVLSPTKVKTPRKSILIKTPKSLSSNKSTSDEKDLDNQSTMTMRNDERDLNHKSFSKLNKGMTPRKRRSDEGDLCATPTTKMAKTPRKSAYDEKLLNGMQTTKVSVGKTPRKSASNESSSDNTRTTKVLMGKASEMSNEKDLHYTPNPKKVKLNSQKSKSSPKKVAKSAEKSPTSVPRKTIYPGSRQLSPRRITLAAETHVSSPRGVRRKLSPSSSAERAAKMLKTSSPKKPDKNKKAALLVLGKANRKQVLAQNVKVLLKQKIVKKAIKQSTAVATQKVGSRKITTAKLSKALGKNTLKAKKKYVKKGKSVAQKSPGKTSSASSIVSKSPVNDKTRDGSLQGKIAQESCESNFFKVSTSPRHSSKGVPVENSPSKLSKKESPNSILQHRSPSNESSLLFGSYGKTAESYLVNSNRRSKRLSSKNDTGRPDFVELSPTALGLMPKHASMFKTPKENKRRSLSLVTPKSVRNTGIITSASTSKIGNRKSVRFSSKDLPGNSEFTPNTAERIDFDFSSVHTPDVTVDVFVSPMTEKGSTTTKDFNESKPTVEWEEKISKTCVRKLLQSPQVRNIVESSEHKNTKNDLNDMKGVRQLFATPKTQKSPKNDLTDVRGVKKLLKTPKVQKSPKNDLTDVRGVKKLLKTPKVQKSPKNDLRDVRGVKKLLATPKVQKSPKNDLTDVRGVKKLLSTPKVQKSPKNDLTDVRGVKKLLSTPKPQKSPKNDLRDVRGVKKLLATPKVQKSPKNDLTDLAGVKELLGSPRLQKSPQNELSDLRGVKTLLGSPKTQRSPKNDLSDVRGVKKLLSTPRIKKSPKNDLLNVSGVGNLFESANVDKTTRNSTANTKMSSKVEMTEDVTELKQLLVTKDSESSVKIPKTIPPKVKDFKAIRGRRTIYTTTKGPKNDLSDVAGVRELFSRHKPTSDYNISLTGIAELFNLSEAVEEEKKRKVARKSMPLIALKTPTRKSMRAKKEPESEVEKMSARRGRLRKAATEEIEEKPASDAEEKKSSKRKATEQVKKSGDDTKKSAKVAKKTEATVKKVRGKKKTEPAENVEEKVKSTRKRKVSPAVSELSPPKTRKKNPASEKDSAPDRTVGKTRKVAFKEEADVDKEKRVARSTSKTSGKAKGTKTSSKRESAVKTSTKRIQKVQSRSQKASKTDSGSEVKTSPRKTRSAKAAGEKKTSKTKSKTTGRSIAEKKNASPVVKKSGRRK